MLKSKTAIFVVSNFSIPIFVILPQVNIIDSITLLFHLISITFYYIDAFIKELVKGSGLITLKVIKISV